MHVRHVRKVASKIAGLQCMNADSQSYFIHKIQTLCRSVFRDCCIELGNSADDVERAASITNHVEYLFQSLEIPCSLPEDIARKYQQVCSSSDESIIKAFLVIVPFLIQNIKEIFVEDKMSEVPQNGLRGIPKDKLDHFVCSVRNAEENNKFVELHIESCNILHQLCLESYDKEQPNTEIEDWGKSLAFPQMLRYLRSYFQHSEQDVRLYKRLDLFSCSLKDNMAKRDHIDEVSIHDFSNVLFSLLHFAKFDASKLVRFEINDSKNAPLLCWREGVKCDKYRKTYSELFCIKKESRDEHHLLAFARVYVNGDICLKGIFQSTVMLTASSKNALNRCVTRFHDVTVTKMEDKDSGNLRAVFFATQKEKLLEFLDVLRKELGEHVVDFKGSEVKPCPLSIQSVTSKTDAVLSLRLVYKWGSEAVALDSKDFVISPSLSHVTREGKFKVFAVLFYDQIRNFLFKYLTPDCEVQHVPH